MKLSNLKATYFFKMLSKTCATYYRSCSYTNYTRSLSKVKPQRKINKEEKVDNTLANAIKKYEVNSPIDWKMLREEVIKSSRNITPQNIDALTVNFCATHKKYKLAESYFDYLEEEKVKPNLATIGKYFKMYYLKQQDNLLAKTDEENILNLYKEIRKTYKVLDSITNENLILGLSVTNAWKECINMLNEIKVSAIPHTLTYSVTAAAAFSNKENELAWSILEEMIENNRVPSNDVYIAYLQQCASLKFPEQVTEHLECLFKFLAYHDLKCNEEVANKIVHVSNIIEKQAALTSVFHKGVCGHCKNKLSQANISEEEFAELKEAFLEKVIIGKNLFNKTTPAELERFKEFIENMEKFDVIIDGLNVAYSVGTKQSPNVLSMLLASVVGHFVQKRKSILVLGRIHMMKWPMKNWSYITKYATTFLTENLSHDDPYLLYCALHCGMNTILVSRDLMRSHMYLLKDVHSRKLFNRWLTQNRHHLLHVNVHGKVYFKAPLPYIATAQKNQDYWHIPYQHGSSKSNLNVGENWICFKLKL